MKPWKLRGGVLAGEEDVFLAEALGAGDGLVLAGLPIGVGAFKEGGKVREGQGGFLLPEGGEFGEDRSDGVEEIFGVDGEAGVGGAG